ncbi:MAG: sigma 54-interacting transcriptional regulator, partial [Gammaproteobacteria bacterium]|nr:sigma 54-interacting transcriptional regulator [Gammaproteobacteria bacterium]
VRIVAATHQPLQQLVADGRFRMDLYYRLHVIELRAPALRERGTDIERLAERFIDEFARRYRRPHPGLTGCARQALRSHPWPGNVRELRNRIEQAVLLCDGPDIDAAALALGGVLAGSARAERTLPAASPGGAVVATGTMPAGGGAMLGETGFAHSVALRMPAEGVTLNEMEQALVAEAMKRADGNITRAAALLGISRDQMRYRVDKLDPARRTEQG